jgi:hypothetical protein
LGLEIIKYHNTANTKASRQRKTLKVSIMSGSVYVSVDDRRGVNPTAYNEGLHLFFAIRVFKLS